MTKEQATKILNDNMQNTNLRRHCAGVGFAMAGIYDFLKSNPSTGSGWKNDSPDNRETWEVLGILHDSDYELTKDNWNKHTLLTLQWLEQAGVTKTDPLYLAIQSHNNKITNLRDPQTQMEWALECVDELTGFIVAVALVKPDKKLNSVELSSITKKWKQKAFAPGVHREQIEQCEEKIGIPLNTFIEVTLKAMQQHSDELGL